MPMGRVGCDIEFCRHHFRTAHNFYFVAINTNAVVVLDLN